LRFGWLQYLHAHEAWLFLYLTGAVAKPFLEQLAISFGHRNTISDNEHGLNSFVT
jgi:hypothetical protein